MTSTASPATTWSLAFLARLATLGVGHVVVSPGSRSQALALAAEALSKHPDQPLQLHVVIDERSAGFFGLGLAMQTHQPVALMCTSGSAPAHYLPALIEAKHSGIPLIALTADRPEELQGVGANQTTTQPGMFGPAVHRVLDVSAPDGKPADSKEAHQRADEAYREVVAGAEAGRSGPIQVNVAFREPLSSPVSIQEVATALARASTVDTPPSPSADHPHREVVLDPAPGTIVIAGHRAGPEAEALAVALGAPLIAEVHSGAHFGPHLVVAYREILNDLPDGVVISRVVTVGRPTLSREVAGLLTRGDVEQIVWQRSEPEPATPSRTATVVDKITASKTASRDQAKDWVGPWILASRILLEQQALSLDPPAPEVALVDSDDMAERSKFARAEMEVVRRPLTRRQIAREVWEATWPHDQLVLGSSRMIREFDRVAPGKNVPVWSSRGVSGIDGTIATSRGIARARATAEATGITRVVLGDLALLHDAGSLLLDQGEAEDSRLQVVVVCDGGGSLFDLLEAKQSASEDAFDRVMFTPARANLNALATAYSWNYRQCHTLGDLVEALADSTSPLLIECVVPRAEQ